MSTQKSFVVIISVGLIVGALIKFCVIDILHVSGRSMQPALQDGATLVVNKLAYGLNLPYGNKLLVQWAEPKCDDIVIYLYNNKIVVKRCVAVGGTPLEYSANSQYTLRVGAREITLSQQQYQNLKNSAAVPQGYILAVGDNYDESVDSRTYGFVSTRSILGKVICR